MGNIVVGILAHVDAGKTTLSEGMLYLSGKIRKMGRVDHKDAFLDTYAMEKDRGITIFSKQAVWKTGENAINLVDTPGHVDFSAEMERTLQILDYAILVVSGVDGIQGHTETLWKLLQEYQIPTFLFINKMDQPGAQEEKRMEELKSRLSDSCISFSGEKEKRMEDIAMADEEVLDYFLENNRVERRQIARLIKERKIFPCYFGSALKLQGVEELLEAFDRYMEPFQGGKHFGARVFKIMRDEKGERLTFLKVTGGSLKVKMPVNDKEKVNQIRIYSGARYQTVSEVEAGALCAVTGLSSSRVGQGLGEETTFEEPFLKPVLTYQLLLPEGADAAKVFMELKQLEEEEPLLQIVWNAQLEEIHLQLMGEVQTEILKALIEERFHLSVEFGKGKIVYRETIKAPVIGVGHYEPLRHYAEVHLRMEPLQPGSGLVFDTECSEDILDRNWQRLILTHLQERSHPGVLTGFPITDMKITLTAGRAHLKHTEGGDFRQATYRAVRQGLKSAESVLLEPWYSFQMEIPSEQVGRAMSDIGQKHGSFQEPEPVEGSADMVMIRGSAPVSTMQDYQRDVWTYTKGRGRISLVVKGYEPCHNAEEVIEAIGYDSEKDLENPTGSIFCSHGAGFFVKWDEVPEYMHIEEKGSGPSEEETAAGRKEESVRTASRSPYSYEEDPELLAIMEREFGARQKEKDRYRSYQPTDPTTKIEQRPWKKEEEKKKYLLVDGYNIIFAWDELKTLAESSIDAARNKLIDILSNYQGFTGDTLILVFDAYKVKGSTGEVQKHHNIYVVYTKEAETADQYIEKTTHEIGRKYQVTVATSDALEQVIVMGQGAYRLSARDFYKEVERVEEEIRQINRRKKNPDRNYLLDYAKKEDAQRMEKVRLGEEKFDGSSQDNRVKRTDW